MKLDTLLSIWPLVIFLLTQLILVVVAWTKLNSKVNDHTDKHREADRLRELSEARMDKLEKDVAEYRRDTQEAAKALARMEKGVDQLRQSQEVNFRALEKAMHDRELENSNRMTRIETIAGMRRRGDIEATDGRT